MVFIRCRNSHLISRYLVKVAILANFGKTKLLKQFDTDMMSFLTIVIVLLFVGMGLFRKAMEKLQEQADAEREQANRELEEIISAEEERAHMTEEEHKLSVECAPSVDSAPPKSTYIPLTSIEHFDVEGGRLTVEHIQEDAEEGSRVNLGLNNARQMQENLRKAIIFKEILDRKF